MDGSVKISDFASLIDDRPDERIFRIDRSIYTDQAVFDAEMEAIFERGWVYLCHESQVEQPGSYYAAWMGRQPVFVMRRKDGGLGAFINACSHRAAILTPLRQGKANVLTCRFHGWAYNTDGQCIKIKNEEPGTDRSHFDLKRVPVVESYRGFVFASLVEDVPPLVDHLGAAKVWIDLLVDQAPEGLEVVPGSSTYTILGNWKYQAENGVDGYHVSTVHRVFAATIGHREGSRDTKGMGRTEAGRITGQVASGAYDLGNGHMSIWATHTTPEVRPVWARKADLEARLTPAQVKWILERGRNLYLFPNMLLMDNPSTQIRYMRPLGPNRTDVTVRCIAPKGEDPAVRAARLRKFEDFYLTSGMATSDDIAALEDTQDGSMARNARWSEFHRGYDTVTFGADEGAKAVGFEPASSAANWEHETVFHGFYRHWLRCITNGGGQ